MMLKGWKVWLAVLGAFGIGQLDPLGRAYLKLAEGVLPGMKVESLANPSPFESIPSDEWVGESEHAFAVNDIDPQAPVHLLVIPKERIANILDASPELIAEMIGLARSLARSLAHERGVDESGFRLVINTNPQGGQTVYHLHMHLIGGRQMGWLG